VIVSIIDPAGSLVQISMTNLAVLISIIGAAAPIILNISQHHRYQNCPGSIFVAALVERVDLPLCAPSVATNRLKI